MRAPSNHALWANGGSAGLCPRPQAVAWEWPVSLSMRRQAPRCGTGRFLSAPAAEKRKEVAGQGVGVGGGAVDVGGGPGAEHWQAEDVKSGDAGDHAAVVADAPGAVMRGDVEPGVVGPETRGPQDLSDLPPGQVQLQGGARIDVSGREAVRRRELAVVARRRGPLVRSEE